MIAEGNETPGGEAAGAAEGGRGRRSEGDLLAERRARRTAESGEHALTLRAEAAEATVRTLETHVTSLQQRLSDAEQESRRIADLLDAERAPRVGERADIARRAQPSPREPELERDLQRASQREYAEQRLRVEAEDRSAQLQRESRVEIERLRRRLGASEREAQGLGARLEVLERQLAEAEQAAATEHTELLRAERALRSRIGELEGAAVQLHGSLEAERAARRRAEDLLDAFRDAQRSALGLLGGLADTIARLRASSIAPTPPPATPPPAIPPPPAAAAPPAARPPAQVAPAATGPLGAGASAAHPPAPSRRPREPRPGGAAEAPGETAGTAATGEMAQALAEAVQRLRARVEEQAEGAPAPAAKQPAHKHSMSLITRTRLAVRRRRERRKERRER